MKRAILFTVLTIMLFAALLPFAWSWSRARAASIEDQAALEYVRQIAAIEDDLAMDFWALLNTTSYITRDPPMVSLTGLRVMNYTVRFASYTTFLESYADTMNAAFNLSIIPAFSLSQANITIGPTALSMQNVTITQQINAIITLEENAVPQQRIQLANTSNPQVNTIILLQNGSVLSNVSNPQLWLFVDGQNRTKALLVNIMQGTYMISGDTNLLGFIQQPPQVNITASLAYVITRIDFVMNSSDTIIMKAGWMNVSERAGISKSGPLLLGTG